MQAKTLVLVALAAAHALAHADDPPPTDLEPIIVTATRSPQPDNRLPAAVSVITRRDIERSGAQHLLQVLRLAGAAQVTDLFGDGSRASVDLRGFGDGAHSTTLILVDGRRLNNGDIASADLSTISLKDVERIEILQGSAGVLYGDQAVGGVINIITRVPSGFAASVDGGRGSHDGSQARLALEQRTGAWSYRLSAESARSDNYRDHNQRRYGNTLLRAGYEGPGAAVLLEAGWIDEELQTPGALFADEVRTNRRQSTPNFRNDFSDTATGVLRAHWRQDLPGTWSLQTDATFRESDGRFRLGSAAFGPSLADSTQDRIVRSLNPRLSGSFDSAWGAGLVTAGIDAQLADYELSSPFGIQRNQQRQLDGYAQVIVPLPAGLEATLGGRLARVRNEVFDGFTFDTPTRFHDVRRSGELGLNYRPLEGVRLFARHDRNFRFAKVDEFTNAGAAPGSGIVNLRTQAGDSIEAGAAWTTRSLTLTSMLYRLDLEDEITFDPTTFTNINLPRTRREGVMLEADWALHARLDLGARLHEVSARVTGGPFAGNAIPLVARRTGKFFARTALTPALFAGLEAEAVDPRAFSGDFDNSLGRLPGYAVLNLNLGWALGPLHLGARINNLLDKAYSEYGAAGLDPSFNETESFFPAPERHGWLSLRYDW